MGRVGKLVQKMEDYLQHRPNGLGLKSPETFIVVIFPLNRGGRGNHWIIGSLFRHYSVQTGLLCQRGRDRVSKKQLEPPEHLPPSALFLREAFLYHCPKICGNFPNAPLNMELCCEKISQFFPRSAIKYFGLDRNPSSLPFPSFLSKNHGQKADSKNPKIREQ